MLDLADTNALTELNAQYSSLGNVSTHNGTLSGFSASPDITCNGDLFGRNLNIMDCRSAQQYITPDSIQHTWGPRHSGLADLDFPLPIRIMGGMYGGNLS